MHSWLSKKSTSGMKKWKKRWFKLVGDQLIYFKESQPKDVDMKKNPPRGFIPLTSETTISRLQDSLQFAIVTSDREYLLQTENTEDKEDWIIVLEQVFKQLQERQDNGKNPWIRKEDQSEQMDRREGIVQVRTRFGWSKRWATLHNGIFVFRKNQKDSVISGKFSLYNANIQEIETPKMHCVCISSGSKNITLRSQNEEDFQAWLNVIMTQKVILEAQVGDISSH